MRHNDFVAVFADPDVADKGLQSLHDEGVKTARVVSPAPYPLVHHTGHPGAWRALGWIALVGGMTGLGCAIAIQVVTSRSMNLIVGGKPIISWTAFGIIMFELTLLFAGVANFSALIILSAVTRWWFPRKARQQVTSERIVVVVPMGGLPEERKKVIRSALSHAVEVLS